MTFTDFITTRRTTASKPTADIRSRWVSRIIARNLHEQGAAGADTYLRDYGRGISAAKVIALAIQAECEGCDDLARGFWAAAYRLETGLTPADQSVSDVGSTQNADHPHIPPALPTTQQPPVLAELPAHLQPGRVITMQPVDASRTREDYIADPAYLGQPKRDGSRIVVCATNHTVCYQGRSTALLASPSIIFDGVFVRVAAALGPFVLDGELVFLDASGGEHRTGSQAAQANATNGHPDAPVRCRICVFKALFARGRDLTVEREYVRIASADAIVRTAQGMLIKAGVQHHDVEQVFTARTTAQKQALVSRQQAEGREGEVWVRTDTTYIGGKGGGEAIVRTKYLEEREVVITALTSTTVAGRPFGAIEVAEARSDGAGAPLGRVGSGFSTADANAIAALVARHPEGLRILVRHQGCTENGMLWHARFLRIVGPIGMVA